MLAGIPTRCGAGCYVLGAGRDVDSAGDGLYPASGVADHPELGQLAGSEPGLGIHQHWWPHDVCVYQGEQIELGDAKPGCGVSGGQGGGIR
jgi:hypothetical protein